MYAWLHDNDFTAHGCRNGAGIRPKHHTPYAGAVRQPDTVQVAVAVRQQHRAYADQAGRRA